MTSVDILREVCQRVCETSDAVVTSSSVGGFGLALSLAYEDR